MGLFLISLMWQPVVMDSRSWAQEKAAEIQVPKGTLDAVTAILSRRRIREYTPIIPMVTRRKRR